MVSRGTDWEVPILLACVTGARRAEILGLSWGVADLKSGAVFIRRGLQCAPHGGGGGRVEFTPLKTKRSNRLIHLPTFALDRIRQHWDEQLERRRTLGALWRDPLDELGRPMR